jgi:hypothetical protein
VLGFGIWWLAPLLTIFQLCRGCLFYWWRKPPTCLKSLTNFIMRRKISWTDGRTDGRTEVKQYTPSPFGERGYNNNKIMFIYLLIQNFWWLYLTIEKCWWIWYLKPNYKAIIMTFQCTIIENEKCCRIYGAVLFKYSNYDLTT